jgi:putative drug exporter of the RND superfamily
MLERLSGLITRRPLFVLGIWAGVLAVAFATAVAGVVGPPVTERLGSGDLIVRGGALEGSNLVRETTLDGPAVLLILENVSLNARVNRSGAVYQAPDVKAQFDRVRPRILRLSGVLRVQDAFQGAAIGRYDETTAPFISDRQDRVLMAVILRKDLPAEQRAALTEQVSRELDTVAPAIPGTTGLVGGEDTLKADITRYSEHDVQSGELVALPISLLLMVIVFAGFLAAGLPIVGAIAGIVCSLGSLLVFSYVIDLDPVVVNIVTVLGLGLSIDYGLLLVSRYREEFSALGGADIASDAARERALAAALGSSGRTILFSGLTIAIALSGLLVFNTTLLQAMGAAGISTVIVSMASAVTLVPALIVLAGPRLLRPSSLTKARGIGPMLRAFGEIAPPEGAFSKLCRVTQRFPGLTVWIVLAALFLAALPVARMDIVSTTAGLLPRGEQQRELFDTLEQHFSLAAPPPIQVVAAAPAGDVQSLVEQLKEIPAVSQVDPPVQQSDDYRRVTVIGVRVAGSRDSQPTAAVVHRIRDLTPGYRVWVTGPSVVTVDYLADIRSRGPLAAAIVVLATFVLLFLMTGSLLIPIKALLMNVVSLGASLGIVVWAFQDGALEGLLGFTSVGGIETYVPPIVLAFGFGLAMDYEVFLLSRITENKRNGMSNDEAVSAGLQSSGRIITSAALILIIVFIGLLTGRVLMIKETGLALAASVLVDASLVRMLLVPATMTLLGDWNWWAPPFMRRWHERFGISEGSAAGSAARPGVAGGPLTPEPGTSWPPVPSPAYGRHQMRERIRN